MRAVRRQPQTLSAALAAGASIDAWFLLEWL